MDKLNFAVTGLNPLTFDSRPLMTISADGVLTMGEHVTPREVVQAIEAEWMRTRIAPSPAAQAAIDAGYQTDANSAGHIEAVLGAAPSPAASIGEDAEFSEVLDDVLQDTDLGYEKRERATSKIVAAADRYIAARLASQSASAKDVAYDELLYAVGIKHPNESRHETALRYIKQAEAPVTVCAAMTKADQ